MPLQTIGVNNDLFFIIIIIFGEDDETDEVFTYEKKNWQEIRTALRQRFDICNNKWSIAIIVIVCDF